ncbi:hypothetical protein MSPP1_002114 [Malassezia sp. CBS 17886]|nr:hypothetical protein MSPP1_002114 [Malassezia sp. CBS 17886]
MRRSQTPHTEPEFAKIKSSQKQCHWYTLPGLEDALKTHFPKAGRIASFVDGDDEAQQVWSDIKKSGIIPKHVQVKEGIQKHMGVSDKQSESYPDSDPDCWWTATGCKKPKANTLPADLSECAEDNTWGLTFDDGPNCTHNAFYDFLQEKKLRASLFYIGANVVSYPLQAQRGLIDGHDLCGHTWSHRYTTTLTNEQVFAELYYTAKAIKMVTGVTTRCWRPPYGDVDDRVRAIATGLGLRTILWQEDTDDWNIEPSGDKPESKIKSNYERIFKKKKTSKPIVLTHEINEYTMDEFMKMYPELDKAFDTVASPMTCLGITQPYAENITYPTLQQYKQGNLQVSGLPSGSDIKFNPKAKFTPVTVNNQKGGFAAAKDGKLAANGGGQGKSSSSSSKSSSSSGGGSSKSKSKSSGGSSSSSNSSGDSSNSNSNSNRHAASPGSSSSNDGGSSASSSDGTSDTSNDDASAKSAAFTIRPSVTLRILPNTMWEPVARGLALAGNGLFLGMQVSVSNVMLPAVLNNPTCSVQQKLKLWSDMYDHVVRDWVPYVPFSTLAYAAAAAMSTPENSTPMIWASVFMAGVFATHLLFVRSYVARLKSYLGSKDAPPDDAIVAEMKTWGRAHWTRTASSAVALAIGVVSTVQRR